MSQNHRPAAPAIDLTKKSSLFEVPMNNIAHYPLGQPMRGDDVMSDA
jgi:hypothetical protein